MAGIIPKVKKAAHIGIKKDKKTDNTITQEEFDKLKPKPRTDLNKKITVRKEIMKDDPIHLIEKNNGMIEALQNMSDHQNERISELSERIGELRNMILENEKTVDKIDTDFSTVNNMISDLDHENLSKAMNILKNEIEKSDGMINENKNMISKLQENISGTESMTDWSKKIRELEKSIIKNRADQEKISGKLRKMDILKDDMNKFGKMAKAVQLKEAKVDDYIKTAVENGKLMAKIQKTVDSRSEKPDKKIFMTIKDMENKLEKLKNVMISRIENLEKLKINSKLNAGNTEEYRKELHPLMDTVHILTEQINAIKSDIVEMKSKYNDVRTQKGGLDSKTKNDIDYIKSKMDMIENLKMEEIFGQFERVVLNLKKKQDDIDKKLIELKNVQSPEDIKIDIKPSKNKKMEKEKTALYETLIPNNEEDEDAKNEKVLPEIPSLKTEEPEEPEKINESIESIKSELEDLIDEANENMNNNDFEMARSLYDHILSLYKTIATKVSYTYAQGLYSRILELSERLENSINNQ